MYFFPGRWISLALFIRFFSHGWTSMVLTCTDENSDDSFAVTGDTTWIFVV